MEKLYLSGNIKVDEVSLKKIFIYKLNYIYLILDWLAENLPELAKAVAYGDLENAIEELTSEVKVQICRINEIFILLKEAPNKNNNPVTSELLQILTPDYTFETTDNLLRDLYFVFYLQKIIGIQKSYFYILKSISNTLNDINIKQYLQYSCDECDDNQIIFTLIAKEYMESTINTFLLQH